VTRRARVVPSTSRERARERAIDDDVEDATRGRRRRRAAMDDVTVHHSRFVCVVFFIANDATTVWSRLNE